MGLPYDYSDVRLTHVKHRIQTPRGIADGTSPVAPTFIDTMIRHATLQTSNSLVARTAVLSRPNTPKSLWRLVRLIL